MEVSVHKWHLSSHLKCVQVLKVKRSFEVFFEVFRYVT